MRKYKKFATNRNAILLYSSIIVEAFNEMVHDLELTDKPIMEGGREGKEIFETDRKSLKCALVVMSFVGNWIHVNLRNKLLSMGMTEKKYLRCKAKTYEQRFMLIGYYDEILLSKVSCYRMARNKILFEIDKFDEVQILFIEAEAAKAYELFVELTNEFEKS